jgi:hypothetical protein
MPFSESRRVPVTKRLQPKIRYEPYFQASPRNLEYAGTKYAGFGSGLKDWISIIH